MVPDEKPRIWSHRVELVYITYTVQQQLLVPRRALRKRASSEVEDLNNI